MFKAKEDLFGNQGWDSPGDEERFYLYKQQPFLCGILAFRITLNMQNAGILLCNVWGTIMLPAHLYNVLKQEINLVESWPLLDNAIAIHTEERLFVGQTPKTLDASMKQVMLILGCSPVTFARDRRSRGYVMSKKGPRELKGTTVLNNSFKRYFDLDGSQDFTIHNVEELLNAQARDADLASNPKSKMLRREWETKKQLTHSQLLEVSSSANLPK